MPNSNIFQIPYPWTFFSLKLNGFFLLRGEGERERERESLENYLTQKKKSQKEFEIPNDNNQFVN